MASDEARLLVTLDANIAKLANQLKKANGEIDDFGKKADRKTKEAGKKIADNLNKSFNSGGAFRLDQLNNLGYQVNDVVSGLAMGQRPLQILAQQGGQVYQILSSAQGGVGGALKDLGARAAALATPIRLLTGGFIGAATAAAYLGISWGQTQRQIELGLSGIGAASGATVNDINDIGIAAAATGRMSASAARDIALAVAASGRVSAGNLPGIVDLAPGYAKLTGKSLPDAGKDLANIFSDPAKGASTLNAILGTLDDKTKQYIITLARQGDSQQAINALVKAVQPDLIKVGENVSWLSQAWNKVSTAADAAGQAMYNATVGYRPQAPGGSMQEQLNAAQAYLAELEKIAASNARLGIRGRGVFGPQQQREIDDARKRVEALKKSIEDAQKAGVDKGNSLASERIGEIVRQYDAAGVAIKEVEAQIKQLDDALGNSAVTDKVEGGVARVREALEGYRGRVALLKQDYEKGGAAAAAALRQAQFNSQVAGLSSYERGLRDITFRFDEMRRAAEAAGNVKALPTIDAQRQEALTAYQREAAVRSRQEVVLPPDIANIIVGAEGNNPAKNSRSSASGFGQFIDSTFITLYREVYSNLSAGLSDANILAEKANREVNTRLVEEYARRNALVLQGAGFDPSQRNLYLSHFLGPQGAVNALRADPNANAASVLGNQAAASNPEVFKNGAASIQDILNFAQRRVQVYSQVGRAQQQAAIAQRAENSAYEQGVVAQTKLASIQEQLNADREAGGELGRRFATADELLKAKSDELTPALAAQREEILRLAQARAGVAAAGLNLRFEKDLQEARDALGRTSEEQAIYQQAKQYAQPGTAEFDTYIQKLTELKEVANTKDMAGGFLKGLASDLMNGTKLSVALTNQLKRLAASLTDKLLDKFLTGLLGGNGGILGSVLSVFGGGSTGTGGLYDSGGYTGSGGKFEPAGIVHKGEVVWSQDDVRRAGGVGIVEAMRRGYANGGVVGGVPNIPHIARAMPSGSVKVTVNNNAPNTRAESSTDANGNTTINVEEVVQMVEGRMAQRVGRGRGPFAPILSRQVPRLG